MSYNIGQVIYVLSNKTQTILPGIIQQEILHRSLDGESVSYKIAIGPHEKQRIIDLSNVDGEVYGTIDEVRQVLISKLTSYIDGLCDSTMAKVNAWYGASEKPVTFNASNGEKVDPSVFLEEVSQPVQQTVQQNQIRTKQNLRASMLDPELTAREIVMPDGSIQKVSINIPQG